MERMTEYLPDLKEIQMILFYIKYDPNTGIEAEKAVSIFAGLRNKKVGLANPDISMDSLQDSANGMVDLLWLQKYFCNHGGGGGFTVSSADRHGGFVVAHHLSQKLCAGQAGKPQLFHGGVFRVVFVDSGGIYHQIDIIGYISRRCP